MELDSEFESKLEEQVLDAAEERVRDADGPVAEAIDRSERQLEAVADQQDYDVEGVLNSLEGPDITRRGGEIVVEWGWTHPRANFFEGGTEDHTTEGNPTLSFVWEGAPAGIVNQFSDRWDPSPRVYFSSVEVAGIVAARYAREGTNWLRHELRNEGL